MPATAQTYFTQRHITHNALLTEWSQDPLYMLSWSGQATPDTHWEWPCRVAFGASCRGPSATAELASAVISSLRFLLTALLAVAGARAASSAAEATSLPAQTANSLQGKKSLHRRAS